MRKLNNRQSPIKKAMYISKLIKVKFELKSKRVKRNKIYKRYKRNKSTVVKD